MLNQVLIAIYLLVAMFFIQNFPQTKLLIKNSVKTQNCSPILSGDTLTGVTHSKSMKRLDYKLWINLLQVLNTPAEIPG